MPRPTLVGLFLLIANSIIYMGSNPLNLAVRFLLELGALASVGMWGWYAHSSPLNFILAVCLPIAFAAMWGVFAVPNDPSRSGKTVIAVSGTVRLVLEILIFASATLAIYQVGHTRISYVFGIIVLLHYMVSYDRVLWLFKSKT
jgi:hypothetical protein